jgi:hypothetical protein
MLPSEYRAILAEGIGALRCIEAECRERAERSPKAPELWLVVRDLGSLADRLASEDDWGWQTGFAGSLISPRDLGVLDEQAARIAPSPYRDQDSGTARAATVAKLEALRAFLARYDAQDFVFEDPATYRTAGTTAPAS